jgi:hypothetical protein
VLTPSSKIPTLKINKGFGKWLLCEKAEKKNKPLLSETIKI